jgi:hypothetical protein
MQAREGAFQRFPQVLQQVPAIDHLLSVRSAFGGSAQVFGGAIATNHLHAGMALEPLTKSISATVRQQINWSMRLQIDEDRAIGSPSLQGKIVHAQHTRRCERDGARLLSAAQECIRTHHDTHLASELRARLTTHGNRHQIQQRPQARRASSLNRDHVWYSFHKSLLGTSSILTAKAPHMEDQANALTTHWQIGG